MPATNVKSEWLSGNLVFYDKDRNVIFTIDGTNRRLTFPGTGILNLAAGSILAADIGTGAVTAAKIGAAAVTAPKLATGLVDYYTADGINEAAGGGVITITPVGSAPAIVATDEVVMAMVYTTKASIATQALRSKADFTTGAGTITASANPVNNTNNQYLFAVVHHA